MVRVCHKLASINEVYMLNLGLRKVNQKNPAPHTISFHRTPQREKHKHRTFEITATPQVEILFTASPH